MDNNFGKLQKLGSRLEIKGILPLVIKKEKGKFRVLRNIYC